jgi:polyisoprenoid-binding protein YceI
VTRLFKTTTMAALLAALPAAAVLAQAPAAPAKAAAPAAAGPETFNVDRVHSDATFQVRHFVSKVRGRFGDFEGVVQLDRAKPETSSVEFKIKTASIDTDNQQRDDHLRGPDFFDAAKHPEITFKSSKVVAKSPNQFDVTGAFTLHGVTKEITLPVSFLGFSPDGRGGEKAGFEINSVINRKDYGIVWNRNLDAGGTILGDDVQISLNIEANKKKDAPPAN